MTDRMSILESNDKSLELLSINGTEESSNLKTFNDLKNHLIDQQVSYHENTAKDCNNDLEITSKDTINMIPQKCSIKIEADLESMMDWVAVVAEEGEEPIEIPTENDGTILLSSLRAQFSEAIGLKFRNPSTNILRGVRMLDNVLHAPYPGQKWGNCTYICTKSPEQSTGLKSAKKCEMAVKRKFDTDPDGMLCKNKRIDENDDNNKESDSEDSGTCDLIVLNIPYATDEEMIRSYFEKFGEIVMFELKKHADGSSRGFGFIRYKKVEAQNKVTMTRHWINQRWCEVKIPNSQEIKNVMSQVNSKIFVSRLTDSITSDDLKGHFESFGTITEIFIPKPFRNFAFVTFSEQRSAEALFGREHTIKGQKVQINPAEPRGNTEKTLRGNINRHRESVNRFKRDEEKMDWRESVSNDFKQRIERSSSRSNHNLNEPHDPRTRYLSPWMNGYYDNERYFPERYQRRGYY